LSEPVKKLNQANPESYSPRKPLIASLVKKIVESSSEIPAIEIYHVQREPYQVLGMENKFNNEERNPDCGARWRSFSEVGGADKVKPFQTEKSLLGVFCQSEQGYYNYLIGAVVSGVKEAPEGMFLANFPASDYMVVTHEWVQSGREADNQIGRIVGYAHGAELQLTDGYEKYTDPIMFIEGYNYDNEDKKFRFEVWIAIKRSN
jgi:predicted transcriptional regulator YdeE